jgi:hypothetical protein
MLVSPGEIIMRQLILFFILIALGLPSPPLKAQTFQPGQVWAFTVAQLNPSQEVLYGSMTIDSLDYDDGDIAYYSATFHLRNLTLPGTITDIYSVYVVALDFRSGDNGWYSENISDPDQFGGQYTTYGPHLGNTSGIFSTRPLPPAKLSGNILLEDCAQPSGQLITLEFHPIEGGSPFTRQASLGANGAFEVSSLPPKQYRVRIKGRKWLAKTIPVDARNGDVTGVNVPLLAGDANNDNSVDVFDLDALVQAFNSLPGETNWNETADFNCDGSVDVFDLDILVRNFNEQGNS